MAVRDVDTEPLRGLAFGLSALGLFSLISLEVADRRHEFAVRIALGASRERIVGSALVSIATPAVSGLLLGLIASTAGAWTIRAQLLGVELSDAPTYGVVILLIICVTALAAYVPARRVAHANPLMLFRPE